MGTHVRIKDFKFKKKNKKLKLKKKKKKWLCSITDSMDMDLSKLQEIVKNRGAWHIAVHGVTNS